MYKPKQDLFTQRLYTIKNVLRKKSEAKQREKQRLLDSANSQILDYGLRGLDLFRSYAQGTPLPNNAKFTYEMGLYLTDVYMPWFFQTDYYWSWLWQRNYNRLALLTCANQVGKSTANIRKCLRLAYDIDDVWGKLWPTVPVPNLFWYFYPSFEQVDVEWRTKWLPLMTSERNCPRFGYELIEQKYKKKDIIAEVRFNTGVNLIFKSYHQHEISLQSSTVYGLFIDEELPEKLWGELKSRTASCRGLVSGVFTPTIGQELFAHAFDDRLKGTEQENFPSAYKVKISLYDCKYYCKINWSDKNKTTGQDLVMDIQQPKLVDHKGNVIQRKEKTSPDLSKGWIYDHNNKPILEFNLMGERAWTDEDIQRFEEDCVNERTRLVRIMGEFIRESGLMYHGYLEQKNNLHNIKVPRTWDYYVGVDIGSGGTNHPAAIVFVATSEDHRQGLVIDAWRGDKIETTADMIFNKYLEMKYRHKAYFGKEPIVRTYDGAARDFFLVSRKAGESFKSAKKDRKEGIDLLNTLFNLQGLSLLMTDYVGELNPYMRLLQRELQTVPSEEDQKKVEMAGIRDDLVDALRYCCFVIPWNLDYIVQNVDLKKHYEASLKKSKEPPYVNILIEVYKKQGYRGMMNEAMNMKRNFDLAQEQGKVLNERMYQRQFNEAIEFLNSEMQGSYPMNNWRSEHTKIGPTHPLMMLRNKNNEITMMGRG